jgi:hypothetical protein
MLRTKKYRHVSGAAVRPPTIRAVKPVASGLLAGGKIARMSNGVKRRTMIVVNVRDTRIMQDMRTVIETHAFSVKAGKIWRENEYEAFIGWISANPTAGDVIPHTGGARKLRWGRDGMGKRGGVRVVFYNLAVDECVLLFEIYAKTARENILPKDLKG